MAGSGAESPPDPPALSLRDVSVVRSGRLIWSEGTFDVPSGGIVAVIGTNGSGKTTLLQVILGLLPIASGTIKVFGMVPGRNARELGDLIGYVPQNYAADSGDVIRARDAVMMGLTGRRWSISRTWAEDKRRVANVLHAVGATEYADRRLSELSGGQRQRIAIAHALVSQPKMLILDEPFAAVDLSTQQELVGLLKNLNDDLGVTIVVVAHDLNPLLSVLHSAIYLLDGHAHYAAIDQVVDQDLLTHLYGTQIHIAHTLQGQLYMRGV